MVKTSSVANVHTARGSIASHTLSLGINVLRFIIIVFLLFMFTFLGVLDLHASIAKTSLHVLTVLILPASKRSRSMNLEPVDARLVATDALLRDESGVNLEQHAVEGAAKVGAINGRVARGLGVVDVFALGAVEANGAHAGNIMLAHGKERVTFAHNAGALAKVALLVLVNLDRR
jgi:hypothetical protein